MLITNWVDVKDMFHKEPIVTEGEEEASHPAHPPQLTIYFCHKCDRDCHARMGLMSHSRKSSSKTKQNENIIFKHSFIYLFILWHEALWATMKKFNIIRKLIGTIQSLYENAMSAVLVQVATGEWFHTSVGVRHRPICLNYMRCVLSVPLPSSIALR